MIFWNILFGCLMIAANALNVIKYYEAKYDKNNEFLYAFQHMVLDNNIKAEQHKLYIGALNKLYQINKDSLLQEQSVNTGPKDDNLACHPHFCPTTHPTPCKKPRSPVDNINKLLLIDFDNKRLVVCGSVLQGICELRELNNIENLLNNFDEKNDCRTDSDYVAANGDLTTVAFIAGNGRNLSMYVGSSKTNKVATDNKFYVDPETLQTVSKRRIPTDPMDIYMFSSYMEGNMVKKGLYVKDSLSKNGFMVNFIQGFAFSKSGYFVITHLKNDPPSEEVSYVAQVCLIDAEFSFNSYLEIPIVSTSIMKGGGFLYKVANASAVSEVGSRLLTQLRTKYRGLRKSLSRNVLFVSFATKDGESAVAVFPMFVIETSFFQLIYDCLTNPDEQTSKDVLWDQEVNLDCSKRRTTLTFENMCSNGESKSMWELDGLRQRKQSLKGDVIFESSDTKITSIAVTVIDDLYTAVFLGTADGRILKLKVDGIGSLISPYEIIPVDTEKMRYHSVPYHIGQPRILPDMIVSEDQTHLFAITQRVAVKIPLQNCSRFETCDTCLGLNDPKTKDPFCVWCTLENKCRGTGECDASGSRVSKTDCPAITANEPVAMSQYYEGDLLELQSSNIPELSSGDNYKCRFWLSTSNVKVETALFHFPNTLSCSLPNPDDIKLINGQANVTISLFHPKNNENSVDFVSTNVTFYKCESFTSCTICVDSSFECHWCIDQHQNRMPTQCRHTSVACQEAFREVTTSEKCPQLEKLTTEYQYIHDQERDKIQIPVQNVDKLGASDYTCEVHVPGSQPTTYLAQRSGNNIECLDVMGNVPSGQSQIEAGIDVYWKNNYPIDNPFDIKITMYRCSQAIGDTCGHCLETDKLLKCGWCQSKDTCTLCKSCLNEQSCYSPDSNTLKSWLASGNKSICKHPRISSFEPKSAPINGQTDITLHGENLGLTHNVQSGTGMIDVIHIGKYQCGILDSSENNAEKVSCRVRSQVKEGYEHTIEFCIREGNNCLDSNYRGYSNEEFKFVTPLITGFAPMQGYNRGGTTITFKGENLRTGNNIQVNIGPMGPSTQCVVDKSTQTDTSFECKVECIPLDTDDPGTGLKNVEVSFDGFKTSPSESFSLFDRVQVTSVKPTKTIFSGGIKTVVQGNSLEYVQNFFMVVWLNKKYHATQKCEKDENGGMICLTPSLPDGAKLGSYQLSFNVEDCGTVVPSNEDYINMEYKPDPDLNKFGEGDDNGVYSGGTLVIKGHNLCADAANCDRSTVKVTIGDSETGKECNISSLDSRQIVCQPPVGITGSHDVEVQIGNYRESLGSLNFKNDTVMIVIIISIAIAIILLVVAVVVFKYRRRANQNLETVKELQMRLDMMEAKVAKECKEAFAELQTDMTELDNMSGGGIPFRPYPDYVNRVLFPDPHMFDRLTQELPFTMHNGRNIMRTRQNALDTFDKLIEDKTFLLIFIRTLERQQGFTIKDRGNVAGLLMIILQDRLQYATEILTCLLKDLIHNSIQGSSHPKLLLRRTESVAEKMLTHWFSILLFPFLKDCAGDPLYWLFRAIKQQIDKGPVDSVTGEAKYSLSEDKLIRQTVDYTPLVVLIVDEENMNSAPISVKVLNCDTISQAKEKIIAVLYKNQPFSNHPNPDTYKLHLHCKHAPNVIMSDEDSKNVVEGTWKKLNMLQDYKVVDNSEISLIRVDVPPSVLNSSFASSDTYNRNGMRNNGSSHRLIHMEQQQSLLRPNQHSRAGTPTIEDDKHIWHLVKPSEDQQEGIGDTGTLSVNKMASEIYLTRLLATKGTIQKFVDDLFETVFTTVQRGHGLPLAIKYMFDFLDEQAQWHNITDQEVVYTWKSNCLPLRFWVNLIKNPHFLFDVDKSPLVDSCLTVIGQTFMDSCSTSDHKLGKDSPSNKLLYAKDIPNYKQWVKKYYEDIRYMEPIRDKDLRDFLRDEFRSSKSDFNAEAALMQLYQFVQRFQNEIYDSLESDQNARRNKLKQKLEQVGNTMTSTV